MVVLFTVGWQMAVALIVFVAIVAALITGFGIRGRSKHQRFAAQSARVGGELVDAVSNVWTIRPFPPGIARPNAWPTRSATRPVPSDAAGCTWKRPV